MILAISLVAMSGRMGQESNQYSLNSGEVNSMSASKQLLFLRHRRMVVHTGKGGSGFRVYSCWIHGNPH